MERVELQGMEIHGDGTGRADSANAAVVQSGDELPFSPVETNAQEVVALLEGQGQRVKHKLFFGVEAASRELVREPLPAHAHPAYVERHNEVRERIEDEEPQGLRVKDPLHPILYGTPLIPRLSEVLELAVIGKKGAKRLLKIANRKIAGRRNKGTI